MAEIERVIAEGNRRGIEIEPEEVKTFLHARAVLAIDKSDWAAKTIIENFNKLLSTGVHSVSFARFLLPEIPQSAEEIEADHEACREYAREVLQRVGHVLRSGLSDEAILEMSVEQLATYA